MNPEQIAQIIKLLEKIADRPFTITQATDWPMVYVFILIFIAAMGLFWRDVGKRFDDIKFALQEFKKEDMVNHESLRTEFTKITDGIKQEVKECQEDCCPPRQGRTIQ